QPSLFDEQDLAEVTSPEYPGERLIACKNPYLALDRARTREELLAATEKELDKIVQATKREKRRLKGKDNIGVRVGRNIDKYKVGKHFKITITDDSFSWKRDTEKINSEAALDGIYIIRTSVPEEESSAQDTVRSYKSLSAVEHAFRCLKSVDLKVEPVRHRKPDKVRAHIFICMLAYYLEWHMRSSLAPILFDDEEKELAWALRESVVAQAVRSPSAKQKASRKRNDEGLPVHSFQSLLADLSTIAKNRVRPIAPSGESMAVEFDLVTSPTPLQRRAFELLGVPLTL
ncbi:MAG: transposase, partial [Actinomycetia bacterium]|nr:transposase [Actinomycetes bacterium]